VADVTAPPRAQLYELLCLVAERSQTTSGGGLPAATDAAAVRGRVDAVEVPADHVRRAPLLLPARLRDVDVPGHGVLDVLHVEEVRCPVAPHAAEERHAVVRDELRHGEVEAPRRRCPEHRPLRRVRRDAAVADAALRGRLGRRGSDHALDRRRSEGGHAD
jgi:hypothetical protein